MAPTISGRIIHARYRNLRELGRPEVVSDGDRMHIPPLVTLWFGARVGPARLRTLIDSHRDTNHQRLAPACPLIIM